MLKASLSTLEHTNPPLLKDCLGRAILLSGLPNKIRPRWLEAWPVRFRMKGEEDWLVELPTLEAADHRRFLLKLRDEQEVHRVLRFTSGLKGGWFYDKFRLGTKYPLKVEWMY